MQFVCPGYYIRWSEILIWTSLEKSTPQKHFFFTKFECLNYKETNTSRIKLFTRKMCAIHDVLW